MAPVHDTIVTQVAAGSEGIEASAYRARAGALTLSYLTSGLGRDTLRSVLAQAATDIDLVEDEDLVEPSQEESVDEVFADRYLVEPANPADDPDDPETKMQPAPAGREVPFVAAALQRWLEASPAGAIELGQGMGDAIWPLLAGWTSTVVHALARGPRTLTEIFEEVAVLTWEGVDARVELLEESGMARALPAGPGEEPRFEATDWLRLGIAPLAAAARMELRHPLADMAPIAAADAEAALRLTLPLLRIKSGLSGACSLEVELDEGVVGGRVGMTARIADGEVVACEPELDSGADAWVRGPTAGWLDAVIDRDQRLLDSGGDWRLPRDLLGGLHEALFGWM
jgi:hypothetical protein